MAEVQICDFSVPIHSNGAEARVYILWPCSALELRKFMQDKFAFDPGERDSWEGKCVFATEVDSKHGCPTAVIALRRWKMSANEIALLAHECFHAAEWMLKQSGQNAPLMNPGEPWEAWEDMAYLLQRIMRRALDSISSFKPDE